MKTIEYDVKKAADQMRSYEELSDRELGALVREKLFQNAAWPASLYSTDIATAFGVVGAMRERGFVFWCDCEAVTWSAEFAKGMGDVIGAYDESLPRAICIAALRAIDA